ncbi:MAG: MotE family protein [Parvularcula sp.]
MTEARQMLPMLGALFCVVAGGQLLSLVADAATLPEINTRRIKEIAPDPAPVRTSQSGIQIIDERDQGLAVDDQETILRAEEYALKKERAKIAEEKRKIEAARQVLSGEATASHERLAAMYQKMPAAKAAAVLMELEPSEAATFLDLMPGDAGAEIFAAMPSDKAVQITREIVGRSQKTIGIATN